MSVMLQEEITRVTDIVYTASVVMLFQMICARFKDQTSCYSFESLQAFCQSTTQRVVDQQQVA